MAYDPVTGQWKDEDASVSRGLVRLTSQQTPLMQQARTQGAQAANRRGLLNSSMGVQAGQVAAYNVALPIASQEAQQAHQRNMQGSEQVQQRKLAQMNLGASERATAANLAASFENSYASIVSNIMNNPEMPAAAREQYLQHAARVRDSNLALVEQMYGIDLQWDTPALPTNTPASSPLSPSTPGGKRTQYQEVADMAARWLRDER